MNFSEFVNAIKMRAEEKLPGNVMVSRCDVLKNNEVKRIGLSFRQSGNDLSQTIYLEEYFEQLEEGKSIDDLAEDILLLYEQIQYPNTEEINDLKIYEKIKDKIVYKLINRDTNQQLLKEIPYETFLDLAVVYYLLLDVGKDGAATLLIRESQRKLWGITQKELHQNAHKNTGAKLPVEFKGMNAVIQELVGEPLAGKEYMYVLTNQIRTFGAAALLYEGVMDEIKRKIKGSFFVLPSSVHEVIIVPEQGNVDSVTLEKMVMEINETQVAPEEILSNRIYCYSAEKESQLRIMGNGKNGR